MHAKYDSIQFAGTSYLLRAYLEVVKRLHIGNQYAILKHQMPVQQQHNKTASL